jgi:rusticyanin
MGTATDPSKVMGSLFADAPGPRVSSTQAAALGDQAPTHATIDRAADTITFPSRNVQLTVLASPASGPDQTYRIAGLVNPTMSVPTGATVTLTLINADPDMAHGIVVTAAAPPYGWMPMMTATAAFPGAGLWFLGNPTSAGVHEATMQFTATRPGTYHYLCAVPGHARHGMVGTLTVG